jgi:hypothetical protein
LQQAWHQPAANKFAWRKSNWMFVASNNLPSNSVVSLQKQNACQKYCMNIIMELYGMVKNFSVSH